MAVCRILIAVIVLSGCTTVTTQEPVQPIYSDDLSDPWNRLFSTMFTRVVVHRKTSEFTDAGPFTRLGENDFRLFPVSTRSFERLESGDRAAAPFYPSFILIQGHPNPLDKNRLDAFGRFLGDAMADARPRTPVQRVLMQHDLWGVFDRLPAVDPRVPQLAQMIRKIALTREEIAALPAQYSLARRSLDLPDLFSPGRRWQEIVWFDRRMHDLDTGFRQATRVFVRAGDSVENPSALIDQLRLLTPPQGASEGALSHGMEALAKLAGAALVMQMLTIDRDGEIVATPLVYTAQTRMFARDASATSSVISTEHEISRRLFRTDAERGGLQTIRPEDPGYIPTAGNDYGFASPHFGQVREAILGTLSTRCASCHGTVPHLFTFSLTAIKNDVAVRQLPQPNDDRARYAIAQKETREDYKRLRALWPRP